MRERFSVGATGTHDKLKERYKFYLENRGYKVELEKRILNGKYIIDVYGEKGDDIVLVEVGTIQSKKKLEDLRSKFDNVIHIPYIDDWLKWPWPKDDPHRIPIEVMQKWDAEAREGIELGVSW